MRIILVKTNAGKSKNDHSALHKPGGRKPCWAKRGKIKQSTVHSGAYIIKDHVRAIQEEREVLIKAIIKVRDGLGIDNVKVIGRYLVIENQKYDYNTIQVELNYFFLPLAAIVTCK